MELQQSRRMDKSESEKIKVRKYQKKEKGPNRQQSSQKNKNRKGDIKERRGSQIDLKLYPLRTNGPASASLFISGTS